MMCLFKSDWYPVWAKNSYWVIEDGWGDTHKKYYYIEIQFSPKRNTYKIKCGGLDPKDSKLYTEAVQKLNELINENETTKKSQEEV